MTVVWQDKDGTTVAYSKGAPEMILDSCARQLTDAGEAALLQGRYHRPRTQEGAGDVDVHGAPPLQERADGFVEVAVVPVQPAERAT